MIPIAEIKPGLAVRYNGKSQTVEQITIFRNLNGTIAKRASAVYFCGVLESKPLWHLAGKGFVYADPPQNTK